MKTVVLKELELTNYRNIDYAIYKFDGNSKIVGENGIGKTNTLEAIYILLTNRLLNDSNDLASIKPLSDTSKEVKIKGTFEVDGKTLTLEKQYGEDWVKTRGSKEKVMKGHYTNYLYNGTKQTTLKNYNELYMQDFGIFDVGSSIDVVQMLINPFYIGNMGDAGSWTNLRNFIISLVGDVNDDDVFSKEPKTIIIRSDLQKANGRIDQLKKQYQSEITGLKSLIESEDAQIDLLEKTEKPTDDEVTVAKKGIEEHETKIANLRSATGTDIASIQIKEKINLKVQEFNEQKEKELREFSLNSENPELSKIKQEINNLDSQISNAINLKLDLNQKRHDILNNIDSQRNIIDNCLLVRGNIIKKLNELDVEKENVDSQIETECPTCHQPLPTEKIEKAKQGLIEKIQEEHQELINRGISNKTKKTQAEEDLKSLESALKNLDEKINEIQKEYDGLKDKRIAAIEKQNQLSQDKPVYVESQKLLSLRKEKEELEKQLQESVNAFNLGTQNNRDLIYQEEELIKPFKKVIDDLAFYERQMKVLEEIKNLQKENANKLLDYEQKTDAINLFVYTRLRMLDENVSKVFGNIKFQLIKENINGGFDTVCKPFIYDVDSDKSSDVLWKNGSKSERVVTGIAIVEKIKERLGLPNFPYLFDEGGEISTDTFNRKFKTNSQLICVKVEDNVLKPVIVKI